MAESRQAGTTATPGVLVTGTDTGVGKSLCSVALLHALRARGLRAVGMKPVAAGCEPTGDGLRNEDALALQGASVPRPAYADVNPWALPEPTAPQLAARAAGVRVELAPFRGEVIVFTPDETGAVTGLTYQGQRFDRR